jgi:malonyl CoA-acyl carrier protein transacylase
MSSVKKPQSLFLMGLFSVLRLFQGKATFRNLSRYSGMHEKRFSRWSRRAFDFAHFNARLLDQELPKDHERIAAIDASFMKKSGKHTEGLGYFYHSQAGKAEKGLEISLISLIDLNANTGYAIDARQTVDVEEQSRVDLYARHFREVAPVLKKASIRYLAADSYYSKVKFIDAVAKKRLTWWVNCGLMRICTGFTQATIKAVAARKNTMEKSISCPRERVLTLTSHGRTVSICTARWSIANALSETSG